MTADLQTGIIAAPGEKLTSQHIGVGVVRTNKESSSSPTSPAHNSSKIDVPNPQQGMADPSAASVSANTAATANNTACTSPLTITSMEAAAAAGAAAAANATGNGVPQVVSQVVPVAQSEPSLAVPNVESMLVAPMAKIGLSAAPAVAPPAALPGFDDKKMSRRTPPTEHDNRKLFVGGLPTDVTDQGFLSFFEGYGQVIDSVVMVDRVTKRSRGFGFVTFASEQIANSLLANQGKPGYVIINGKQCEVKASTPKVDDGTSKHGHGHGAPGMWKSNPPYHSQDGRRYSHRHQNQGSHSGQMKQNMHHHQPRGEKNFYLDSDYNGDIDGRNFDDVYSHQPHINASYQAMNAYGRNQPMSNTMYQQNYQNVYPSSATSNGYFYPNSGSATVSIPSSHEASYPAAAASNQGIGQYASSTMPGDSGYYDAYSCQQYPNQYVSHYGNTGSMSHPIMMAHVGYANNSGYYAQAGATMPYQGIDGSDGGGFEPYPQSYEGEEQSATADQYE